MGAELGGLFGEIASQPALGFNRTGRKLGESTVSWNGGGGLCRVGTVAGEQQGGAGEAHFKELAAVRGRRRAPGAELNLDSSGTPEASISI